MYLRLKTLRKKENQTDLVKFLRQLKKGILQQKFPEFTLIFYFLSIFDIKRITLHKKITF